jgi:hypothetical protein
MFELRARTDPDAPIVRAKVEGVDLGTVDVYASVAAYRELALGTVPLSNGPHVVEIVSVGKNPQSSGTALAVDQLRLVSRP